MLRQSILHDSRQLRHSYIEISNFFRGSKHADSHLKSRCLHQRPHKHRYYSRSLPCRRTHVEDELVSSGRDVTKGFPTPPDHGFVGGATDPLSIRGVQMQQTNSSMSAEAEEVQDTSPDHLLPSGTREFLGDYIHKDHLVSDAYPWDFLEYFRKPPGQSEGRKIPVKIYGYVTSERQGKNLIFHDLVDPHLRRAVQVISQRSKRSTSLNPDTASAASPAEAGAEAPDAAHESASPDNLSTVEEAVASAASSAGTQQSESCVMPIKPHTPVLVSGHLVQRSKPVLDASSTSSAQKSGLNPGRSMNTLVKTDPYVGNVNYIKHLEILADSVIPLNSMPDTLLAKADTNVGPERRHVQFRVDSELRQAMRLRSKVMAESRKFLFLKSFDELETPLLFKSTPEGAREFIVPTRSKGMAYALPQSPQQYKQILMASGIHRYFQFARCFRDEDLRADRQPEFTQLDLEMSFASGRDVMIIIERLIAQTIWPGVGNPIPKESKLQADPPLASAAYSPDTKLIFRQLNYHDAMSMYGSDKPDPRLGSKIYRVEEWIPDNLKKMLSPLDKPIVELMMIDMQSQSVKTSGDFITRFLDVASAAVYINNPAGAPGITVYDPQKPLSALASFGHDGAAQVEQLLDPSPGDIIVLQARLDTPFAGGSTPLGNLRRDIHQAAAAQSLRKLPATDSFLWITDFPLFSPIGGGEVGQGGGAGICSTHHPFTAPRSGQDLTKLYTDPLSIIGDHYDLVINGVEVGGGSRRIHQADMQELVFRDVLKMPAERIEDFRHLLNALRSGCPPHAGFALGFDRLMALALGRGSIRDVMTFPKWGNGEDNMVGAPSKMSEEALQTYHLSVKDTEVPEHTTVSVKA